MLRVGGYNTAAPNCSPAIPVSTNCRTSGFIGAPKKMRTASRAGIATTTSLHPSPSRSPTPTTLATASDHAPSTSATGVDERALNSALLALGALAWTLRDLRRLRRLARAELSHRRSPFVWDEASSHPFRDLHAITSDDRMRAIRRARVERARGLRRKVDVRFAFALAAGALCVAPMLALALNNAVF